ncbi:MAG: hypothetical protein COB29_15770 [Sulfitobacter sp.]|jgi:ABC-2 type transport system permease protein|nr:hypothetical protein [Roseobacter sp.]MBV48459.1 hypothetical protein [Roseobacter sp.]PHR00432.1 MAG: hypothetical protein COB29_15770 [Sulfitobacter sp.]|tara:strand:+ start:311 stop:844 length:534 start_codon:yes stop_codon:yes gene_type:complete
MDIVKTASDWARFELLSTVAFMTFGLAFGLAGLGFRQLATTDLARAFTVPMLVAAGLLLILGVGLFFPAQARLAAVPAAFGGDAAGFIASEITRADKVLNDYRIAAFKVFPALLALCALAVPFLDGPYWRASLITAIALFTVLILIDSNANARLQDYRQQLSMAEGSTCSLATGLEC